MRPLALCAICLVLALPLAAPARAADSFDRCDGFIEDLPSGVPDGKVYCLAHDVVHRPENPDYPGKMYITVHMRPGSTLDCLGHAMTTRYAIAIYGDGTDATVRNCRLRPEGATQRGVQLIGKRVVFEDNIVEGYAVWPVFISGDGSVVRRNLVRNVSGSPAILVRGVSDVLDNTVHGVHAQGDAVGINIGTNPGGQVARNRVRGLSSATGKIVAIQSVSAVRALIRDNRLVGDGSGHSQAIACLSAQMRARDNIIDGFIDPLSACGDAGGNDITP
jgi:hypothetical protein